ncbi:MAG: hypothetical protein ACK2UH_05745 [Candidatus Promineifilaceae bacterium]
MNRRILPPTIVAVTSTFILGLLFSIQLFAASATETTTTAGALSVAEAGFTVDPLTQGQFTQAGSTSIFTIEIKNTGDTPTDTYELNLDSNWTAALFGPDGRTPLIDTNSNGGIDTDVVLQGESLAIIARFDTPSDAVIGDANGAQLTVRSTISTSLAHTASMRSAVPAPFAQTLFQQPNRSLNLYMSQPNASWQTQTSPDYWYEEATTTYPNMALTETPSGYFYLWSNLRYISNIWRAELEFLFTNKPGQPVTSIDKLTDHTSVTMETLDAMPAVAIAPNGNIGVSWYRTTKDPDGSQLFNIYLAILDPTGQPVTDTINVTNNTQWRAPIQTEFGVPSFRSPRVAATRDNRFFVAWESSVLSYTEKITKTFDLNDIYYAIYAGDGVTVTEAINASGNVSGTRSLYPAMTRIGADRVFLSWAQRDQGGDDIMYMVVDSNNTPHQTKTPIANDPGPVPIEWSNFDVVELSSGKIIAAWEAYGCGGYPWSPRIRYAVFRSNNYNRDGDPDCLPPTVLAEGGDDGISLVADNHDQAILTWTDRSAGERRRLYYALLDSNGDVVTEPMVFYQNGSSEGLLSTGFYGFASASRIFVDTAVTISPPRRQGISTDPVQFIIDFGNSGSAAGSSAVLTLTLAPSLTFQSATAPSPPAVNGQDVVWTLGDAPPWSGGSFDVTVAIDPSAKLMHAYPLTVTVAVDEQEATLANNSDSAEIIIRRPLYLPWLARPG